MRNVAIVIFSFLVLTMGLMNNIADNVIPGYCKESSSMLEHRDYQTCPHITKESLKSGEFQTLFGDYASDSYPLNENAKLWNARLQRAGIETARIPFGYTCYPTYFGSDCSYCEDTDSLFYKPGNLVLRDMEDADSEDEDSVDIETVNNTLGSLIEDYSDKRWRMALVDHNAFSEASPIHELVSEPKDYSYMRDMFLSALPEQCEVIDLSLHDVEERNCYYFKSDHHWTIRGGFDAYCRIVRSLDMEPLSDPQFFTAYDGAFYGSIARNGLTLQSSDGLEDIVFDANGLSLKVNGKEKSPSWLCRAMEDEPGPIEKDNLFDSVYSRYYHANANLIEIENSLIETNNSLLIIGDSYTCNIDRLFTAHYRHVYVVDPRKPDVNIRDYLDSHEIDDVVFIWSPYTMQNGAVLEQLQ